MKIFLQFLLITVVGFICYSEYSIPDFKFVKNEADKFTVKNNKIIGDTLFVVVSNKNGTYAFKTANKKIKVKNGQEYKLGYKLYKNADKKKNLIITSIFLSKKPLKVESSENFNEITNKIPKNASLTLERRRSK